jgi:hypothetical protein
VTHRLSRVRGFHMHAIDGSIGHVDDFLMDDSSWNIRYVVVDTSNLVGGKWVAISTNAITAVDWVNRTLKVELTRDEIKNSPTLDEANVPSYELTPRFIIM